MQWRDDLPAVALAKAGGGQSFARRMEQRGANIVWFQERKLLQQLLLARAGREPANDLLDRDAQPAHRRLPAHDRGVGGDAL